MYDSNICCLEERRKNTEGCTRTLSSPLIFSEPDLVSLDEYLLNTEAHPSNGNRRLLLFMIYSTQALRYFEPDMNHLCRLSKVDDAP